MRAAGLIFGVLFGFTLSRVGATSYDVITGMFRLTNFHIVYVIAAAVVIGMVGLQGIRRLGLHTVTGAPIVVARARPNAGTVVGSVLFGVGWAVTGAWLMWIWALWVVGRTRYLPSP